MHILIFCKCIAHTQDRHVQLHSPRHQLYEVFGMSAHSPPCYHLNEVVPSGVLPTISGMKSNAFLPTAFSSLLAVCIIGLQAYYDDDQYHLHHASTCQCVFDCCPRESLPCVPSGAFPAICYLTSKTYPHTSPHAHLAYCEPLCSLQASSLLVPIPAESIFSCQVFD